MTSGNEWAPKFADIRAVQLSMEYGQVHDSYELRDKWLQNVISVVGQSRNTGKGMLVGIRSQAAARNVRVSSDECCNTVLLFSL